MMFFFIVTHFTPADWIDGLLDSDVNWLLRKGGLGFRDISALAGE